MTVGILLVALFIFGVWWLTFFTSIEDTSILYRILAGFVCALVICAIAVAFCFFIWAAITYLNTPLFGDKK